MKKFLLLLVGVIVSFASHANVTIYYYDTENWDAVGIWAWGSEANGGYWLNKNYIYSQGSDYEWPGVTMTKVDGTDNLYEATFNEAPSGLIFNNNISSGDNVKKTADLTYVADVPYNYNGAITSLKFKGAFTNWEEKDLPYEHYFNGSQDEQQYGWVINSSFYANNTTFSGNTLSFSLTGNNGNDKIEAKYKGFVRFSCYDGVNAKVEPCNARFYLVGAFNGWSNDSGNLEMSTDDGVTYTYTLTSTLTQAGSGDDGFKINIGTWDLAFGASDTSNLSNISLSSDDGNICVGDLPAGTKLTLTYNPSETSTLKIEKPEEATKYYICGNVWTNGDWAWLDSTGFTQNEDGKYTYSVDFTYANGDNFAIQAMKGDTMSGWYVPANDVTDRGYTPSADGTTYNLMNQTGDIYFSFDHNKITGVVTFELVFGDDGVTPSAVKVSGGSKVPTYTIYYYEASTTDTAGKIGAQIKTGDTCLTEWNSDDALLKETGKYIVIDNVYYPVYSYTFTWKNVTDETTVEFWKRADDGESANAWSSKFSVVNNKVYNGENTSNYTADDLVDSVKKSYTVYYYNTSITSTSNANVKAYVWQDDSNSLTSWDNRESMSPLQQANCYVCVNNVYYPVFYYTFEWDKVPNYIIFTYEKDKTSDLSFTDNMVYNQSGVSGLTVNDFVMEGQTAAAALYFHVKYDFETKAKSGAKLRCHVYNTADTDNDEVKARWNTDDENMVCVDPKYALWKYTLSAGDETKYNAVDFYFEQSNDSNIEYQNCKDSSGAAVDYDAANWTKYIYSTAERTSGYTYAVQSFLSYDDFKALDELDTKNGGRRNLYILGWNNMYWATGVDSNGEPNGWKLLSDDFVAGVNSQKLENDHGCFYLPVQASQSNSRFKVSWINVIDAEKNCGLYVEGKVYQDGELMKARRWATFDLGIIGVNKDYSYTDPSTGTVWKPNVSSNTNAVYFSGNKSVPYMNYNQYDWVLSLDGKVDGETVAAMGNSTYYLTIDTHNLQNSDYDCKTITLTSFDPHPSINVNVKNISKEQLTLSQVQELLNPDDLNGSNNGDVKIEYANHATGSATVNGTDISDLEDAGFERTYMLYVNSTKAMTIEETSGSEDIEINYLPIGTEETITVRGLYKDSKTGLQFLSRTGSGTLSYNTTSNGSQVKSNSEATASETISLAAPSLASTPSYKFVYEGKSDSEDNKVYGLYVSGLKIKLPEVATNEDADDDGSKDLLYNYADFKFYDKDGNTYDAELITTDSDIYKFMVETGHAGSNTSNGEQLIACDSFDYWNEYITTSDNVNIFLHNVARVQNADELVKYDGTKIFCDIIAVYPFLYDTKASNSTTQTSIRRRSESTGSRKAASTYESDPTNELSSTISLSNQTKASTIEGTLSINNVVSDLDLVLPDGDQPAEVEYYTISGIRVSGNLAAGIYLRRQGNRVSKVVIR